MGANTEGRAAGGCGRARKGDWKVTVRTLDGKRFHYWADTEKDADLMALALQFHGRDVAEAVVSAA